MMATKIHKSQNYQSRSEWLTPKYPASQDIVCSFIVSQLLRLLQVFPVYLKEKMAAHCHTMSLSSWISSPHSLLGSAASAAPMGYLLFALWRVLIGWDWGWSCAGSQVVAWLWCLAALSQVQSKRKKGLKPCSQHQSCTHNTCWSFCALHRLGQTGMAWLGAPGVGHLA